jgi:hypothetical protein
MRIRNARVRKSVALATVIASLGLFIKPAPAGGDGNPNPGVMPPDSKPHGKTYGEWEALWWQAILSIPADPDNPFFVGGSFGDEKHVLFLSGVSGPTTVNITIPPGTALFFPMINAESSSLEPPPFHGDTEAEQRAVANDFIHNVTGVFAEIDGRPVVDIENYRTQSPQFTFTVPASNILGVTVPPDTGTSVDAGYYLFLAPLSVGTHTLHFGGTFGADLGFLEIDTTYIVTVQPPGH